MTKALSRFSNFAALALISLAACSHPCRKGADRQPGINNENEGYVYALIERAQKGEPCAANELGLIYEKGRGVPKDCDKAMFWFRKAARSGDPVGQVNLGLAYDEGICIATNTYTAVRWYRKAAAQGHLNGEYMMGIRTMDGKGTVKDCAAAKKWLKLAADKGDPRSQFNLGHLSYYGNTGCAPDVAEGLKWFKRASDQGDPYGQNALGAMYYFGSGVPQDFTAAATLLSTAAYHGVSEARASLGTLYRNGHGVPRDLIESYAWSLLGAAKNDERAKGNMEEISLLMTPKEIAKAQERAKVLQNKIVPAPW